MYAAAEEYQMSDLQQTAQERLGNALEQPANIKEEDLAVAVTLAYTQVRDGDETLRNCMARACARHFASLSQRLTLTMREVPGFGSDIAHGLHSMVKSYDCSRCDNRVGFVSNGMLSDVYCRHCRDGFYGLQARK